MPNDFQISIRGETYRKIREYSKSAGFSTSGLVDRIILNFLNNTGKKHFNKDED